MAVKKILLVGEDMCIRLESIADAAITPGMLLELTATGAKKHAGAGLNAQKLFATENEIAGNGIDDDYAALDTLHMAFCPPGTIVWAIAGTAGVTALAYQESDGAGRLDDATADAATDTAQRNAIVGQALTTAAAAARFQLQVS